MSQGNLRIRCALVEVEFARPDHKKFPGLRDQCIGERT